MKTKQEQIEEMEKIIKAEREMLGSQIKALKKRLNNKYVEIERLKAENGRLTEKLKQILLAVDTVKEMNAMCNIDEQRKQAVKEFAEKLKEEYKKLERHHIGMYDLKGHSAIYECKIKIYELLKEYEG